MHSKLQAPGCLWLVGGWVQVDQYKYISCTIGQAIHVQAVDWELSSFVINSSRLCMCALLLIMRMDCFSFAC